MQRKQGLHFLISRTQCWSNVAGQTIKNIAAGGRVALESLRIPLAAEDGPVLNFDPQIDRAKLSK
jgi:hypothetical protein